MDKILEGFVFIDYSDEESIRILCIERQQDGPVVRLKEWLPGLDNDEICLSWETDVMKYLYSCTHYARINITETEAAELCPTAAEKINGTIYI